MLNQGKNIYLFYINKITVINSLKLLNSIKYWLNWLSKYFNVCPNALPLPEFQLQLQWQKLTDLFGFIFLDDKLVIVMWMRPFYNCSPSK